MTQSPRFVGIDVSASSLDVHCHPDGESFGVSNTPAGHAELIARLGAGPWLAACEATGGHEADLVVAMTEAGRDIWCLHPADVRAFARLTGKRAKTDRLDARLIARALEPASRSRAPLRRTRTQIDLKQLLTLRRHLRATIAELASLLSAFTCMQARDLAEARRMQARHELAALDKAIARRIAQDKASAETARRIMSVPGAGKVLAAEIMASMPELGTISAKQAASLAGVAPHPRQSGTSARPGRCQGGRASLRRCLYMAALSAIKAKSPHLRPCYDRLRANGKPAKLAIVACMRKLITIINAVLRQQTDFNSQPHTISSTVA